MAVLNLRGVPDELAQKLKADAALAGVSLRDYCVLLLSGSGVVSGTQDAPANHREIVQSPGSSDPNTGPVAQRTEQRNSNAGGGGASPSRLTSPCNDCGALIGHQKWCKSRR